TKQLKALAVKHLTDGHSALGIGHEAVPESLYQNPQLYPQAFPWLFPYGLGGIENGNGKSKVSDAARKKALLLYYDKRFQREAMFPLVALNHLQVKSSITGGFVTAKRSQFPKIADKLLNLD
ncbi:hypothetical protein OF83DRAFT_1028120, partial [Amylostereum chailletii]